MTNTDAQLATILDRYGEPADGNVWQVEGQAFIHHKTLERMAGKAKITQPARSEWPCSIPWHGLRSSNQSRQTY